jgi:hypothetical protein
MAVGALGAIAAGAVVTLLLSSELDAARAAAPSAREPSPRVAAAHGWARGKPAARTTAAAPAGETVVEARWGGAPGELGKRGGEESSPEGPMSFVVDEAGRVVVLDQVNSRIQVFEDGRPARVVKLPSDTFQDVAVRGDGLVALDRFGDETVAFIDERGEVTHQVPLRGPGIASGGEVTALAQHEDGTWVERRHQEWVRVADRDGAPDPDRWTVAGRRAHDGGALRLARAGGERASLVHMGDDGSRPVTWLAFDLPIWALVALETDARGRVFVGAELAEEREVAPFDVIGRMVQVIVLDASGVETNRLSLPVSTGPEETFRTLRIGPDGALYQIVFGATGASIRRYAL